MNCFCGGGRKRRDYGPELELVRGIMLQYDNPKNPVGGSPCLRVTRYVYSRRPWPACEERGDVALSDSK